MFVLLFPMTGALMAQQSAASQAPQASVTSLTSKDLREFYRQRSLDDHMGCERLSSSAGKAAFEKELRLT